MFIRQLLFFFIIVLGLFSCKNEPSKKNIKGSLLNDSLVNELNSIYKLDQEYRNDSSILGIKTQINNDALNQWKIENIIKQFGWPKTETIGKSGSRTILLVILHSHISKQRKYLPLVRQAVIENKIPGKDWVFLEDRVSLFNTGMQIYGTQIEWNQVTQQYFIPNIIDEKNVNIRRKKIGLENLETYAKSWGINYKPLKN